MRTAILFALLAATAWAQSADQPQPSSKEDVRREAIQLLREHSYPVQIADGKLSGPGGEKLLEGGRKAQFFVIAEEHHYVAAARDGPPRAAPK